MGIVGRYIDAGTPEQRDRAIEALNWDTPFVLFEDPTCRCLVGHMEDYHVFGFANVARDPVFLPDGTYARRMSDRKHYEVYNKVPELFDRFGKDRIVRLCKQRAAKGNRLHEIRAEVYKGHHDLVPAGGMNGRFPEDLR